MQNAFIANIETELTVAWGDLTQIAESDFGTLKSALLGIATKMIPAQWSILQALATEAIADIEGGDLADLETALLNKAEAQELAWIKELGSEVLQAALAALKLGGGMSS